MAFRVLALVMARSGSKGLRHKNIRQVAGVPLLARCVELARTAARRQEVWDVVASTDSKRYARIARAAGARTPFARPPALASDDAPLIDAVLDCMVALRGEHFAGRAPIEGPDDWPWDAVVMPSVTAPLTNTHDLRRGLKCFRAGGGESVVSICADRIPDPWRFSASSNANGGLTLFSKSPGPIRRRQLGPVGYRLNGAFFIASPIWLTRFRQFYVDGRSKGLIMPENRSIDIENTWDLRMIDGIMSTTNGAKKR